MNIKNILLNVFPVVCFLAITGNGFGQTTKFAPDLNIKTPEVSSMLKFLDTPVSYNTGLPSFNIPVFSIKQGDISYPISVDYNSSGVNVNERAGWVGMGFSINQPQVTRMVKGLVDDKGGFISENQYTVNNGYVEANWPQALKNSVAGIIDLESDEYRVMLPNGENIRFYFSQDRSTQFPHGEIIQVPITNNKITPIFTASVITGWEVVGTDGFIYNFSPGNSTSSTQSYTVNDNLPTLDGKSNTGSYITSWMLSKIKSPTNNELNFTYASFTYNDCNLTGQRRDVGVDLANLPVEQGFVLNTSVQTNYQKTIGYNYFLESIYGDFGRVNFNLDSNTREDYIYGKKLNAITIYDKSLKLINSYAFDYIFKTSDAPIAPIYTCGYIHNPEDINKRMFLEKITILGNADNSKINKPFYSFRYNPLALPHRFSYAVDWWGYFNGAHANESLVPTRFRFDEFMPDRNVNSAYSQAGLLTEIIFPTGGSTKYEFESNRGINDKPLVKHIFMGGSVNYESGFVDGINIIPSVKTGISFNSSTSVPISNVPFQGGRKITYEMPFTVNDNVIGYYYSMLNGSNVYTVNMPLNIKTSCTSCIYEEGTLPEDNGCSVFFKIIKDNNLLCNSLISGSADRNFELAVGSIENDGIHINSQNCKLVVEIYTGHRTVFEEQLYDVNNDNVTLDLNWEIYNPNLVNKIGSKYDMPLGGHRIKSIKTYENPSATPLEKQYEYKDEMGIESGFCNFRLANFFSYGNYYYLNSDNYYPLQFYNGQSVGYSYVKEKSISGSEQQVSTYKYLFFTNPNPNSFGACYLFNGSYGFGIYPCIDDPINGKLIENKIGNEKKIVTDYTTPNPSLNIKYILGFNTSNRWEVGEEVPEPDYVFAKYRISNFHDQKPSRTVVTEYFNGNPVITETNNIYNSTNHLQLISQKITTSLGAVTETKFYYPQDMALEPFMPNLIASNRIFTPIKTETFRGTEKLSEQKTAYASDASTSNLLLQKNIYAAKFPNNLPNVANVGNLEKRITYDQYDSKGNILQYTLENGTPVSIIWGYNQTQPIAKIENVVYSAVQSQVANLQTLSNTGTEPNLIAALTSLRALYPNAMVTTYTHIPLIGVSTITDPKGNKVNYSYDAFGRLQNVKDMDGNILSENEYHYKN